jgi:hypothetical protein
MNASQNALLPPRESIATSRYLDSTGPHALKRHSSANAITATA